MLARETREQFVVEVGHAMVELGAAVQEHLTTLINQIAPAREMQSRRDAWTLYQSQRAAWIDGTMKAWQATLKPAVVAPRKDLEGGLELLGTEVVENKIVASRLVLSVMEKVNAELNDLSVRIKLLEGSDELHDNDIFRPEAPVRIQSRLVITAIREIKATFPTAVGRVMPVKAARSEQRPGQPQAGISDQVMARAPDKLRRDGEVPATVTL